MCISLFDTTHSGPGWICIWTGLDLTGLDGDWIGLNFQVVPGMDQRKGQADRISTERVKSFIVYDYTCTDAKAQRRYR